MKRKTTPTNKKQNSLSQASEPLSFYQLVKSCGLYGHSTEERLEIAIDHILERLGKIEDQLNKIQDKQSGHFLDH